LSARASAIEALRMLVQKISGAPWAGDIVRLASMVAPARRQPDPYLLKVFYFLSERVLSIRDSPEPFAAPEFRLFSEAFMYSGEFQEAVRRGLAAAKARPGSAAVDVHSCTGVCLELAAPQWGKLVAVDPSRLNLELVEERLRGIGASNYELLVGDVLSIARLVRDPVGLAIAASPATWLINPRVLVSRAFSTLEPGGQLLLVAPLERGGFVNPLAPFIAALKGPAPVSRESLEDMMLTEGFARVRSWEGDLLTTIVAVKP